MFGPSRANQLLYNFKSSEISDFEAWIPYDSFTATETERVLKQGRIHGYLSRVRVGRGGEKKAKCDGPTDRPTDRRTDRPTERVVELRARN